MKKFKKIKLSTLMAIGVLVFVLSSCEKTFLIDGDTSSGINSAEKYLYVIDNGSKSLLMLDNNLGEIKNWDLTPIVADNDVRGVTCNDEYLWISVTGTMDQIIQLASNNDNLFVLSTMDAPPSKQGTIRELTWDGNYLWALN
ncbi:MAG: hypothetical protein JW729_04195, partial [Bacteroidales bacterium]|nr:hypothetical protein [Bacteroidales bacterium]